MWGAAQSGGQGFLFGFRVPKDYFIAKGYGDTNDVRPAPINNPYPKPNPSAAREHLLLQRHEHAKDVLLMHTHPSRSVLPCVNYCYAPAVLRAATLTSDGHHNEQAPVKQK